jgi:zinc transporter, ZIP family
MTPPLFTAALYALIPFSTAVAGAAIAVMRPPGARLRSAIQHFAAGVVFSVVAVDLLPDVVRQHRPVWVVLGFVLGIGSMLAMRSFADAKPRPRNQDSEQSRRQTPPMLPTGLVAAMAVDILLDGFLIGIGFAAGAKEGILLVFALALELLSLGLATVVSLRNMGVGGRKSLITTTSLALLIVFGAALGDTVLRSVSGKVMETLLSFGLAALLFLVTEELLVEAHEVPETPLITSSFFAGFLLFLVLGMVN